MGEGRGLLLLVRCAGMSLEETEGYALSRISWSHDSVGSIRGDNLL